MNNGDAMPGWLRGALETLLCLLLAYGVAGVALAVAGWFRPVPVVLSTVALALALVRVVRPWQALSRPGRALPAVLALAIALAFAGAQAKYSSEHVQLDRDPAVYVNTARHLADSGELLVHADTVPFSTEAGATYTTQGYSENGVRGLLYPRFLHLLGVLLAGAAWVGGNYLMLKVPAMLGGLALLLFYAFATRIVRPWPALAATLALGLNLVFVHFARDAYSELPTMAALFGGLWMLAAAHDGLEVRRGFVAGMLIGLACMARIDSFVYWIPLLAWGWIAFARLEGVAGGPRFVAAVLGGAAATAAVGLADGLLRSPVYFRGLSSELIAIGVGAAAVAGVGAGVMLVRARAPALRGLWVRARPRAATVTGLLVILAAVMATLRPELQTVRYDEPEPYLVEIQKLEGVPLDGTRAYRENSMMWLAWYLGPLALAAGVAGFALAVRRTIAGSLDRALPFMLLLAVIAALYVWNPRITPDHLWVMRRFLPVVIPGLLLFAAFGAVALLDAGHGGWRRIAVAALAVAAILHPIHTLRPVAKQSTQAGMLDVTESVCATLGPRAAVVFPGTRGLLYTETVRTFCRVPVALMPETTPPASLRALGERWRANGRRLWVAADSPEAVREFLPGVPEPVGIASPNPFTLEQTLERRPERLVGVPFAIYLAPVPL